MLNFPSYPIKDLASAAAFLRQAGTCDERLACQLRDARAEMAITRDASRFLYVRYGVLECAAAAYALRERDAFCAAAQGILAHGVAEGDGWRPTLAQLGFDLAVALSCRRFDEAHAVGRHILRAGADDDGAVPEHLQARALAHLFDLDAQGAGSVLRQMATAIEAARLPQHERAVLTAWRRAAECVAARSDLDLGGHLADATRTRAAYLDKLLGRWSKGQETDLSPVDFWDWQTTALVIAAQSIGLARGLVPDTLPFSDWQWTGEAGTWA